MDNLIIFVLVIAAVWGLFLLPSLIEARREAPLTSTKRYDQMAARLSMPQAAQANPTNRARVSARRRRTLVVAGLLAVGTLAGAIVTGNVWVLAAHLVIDAFLAWYVAMLVQLRKQEQRVALARRVQDAPVESTPQVRVIAG